MKKEYSKLHERYTELFKTHNDYMERTKSILGTERLDQLGPGAARPRIAGMALNQLNRLVSQSSNDLVGNTRKRNFYANKAKIGLIYIFQLENCAK